MKINYISTFYISDFDKRQEELETVLLKNIANLAFDTLHYFVDNDMALNRLTFLIKGNINAQKVKIAGIKKARYSDLFGYACNIIGEICVITNSDIYFHAMPKNIIQHVSINSNYIYALTRHRYDFSKPLIDNYAGSHDAFIFLSPINRQLLSKITHFQFFLGAENIVIYELERLGYKLYNPCLNIIIVHMHRINCRSTKNNIRINIKRSSMVAPSAIGIDDYKYKFIRYKQKINRFKNYLTSHFSGRLTTTD